MLTSIHCVHYIPVLCCYKITTTILLSLPVDAGELKGLNLRGDHTSQRSLCLNKFAEMYKGVLPLRYTHTRIVYEQC